MSAANGISPHDMPSAKDNDCHTDQIKRINAGSEKPTAALHQEVEKNPRMQAKAAVVISGQMLLLTKSSIDRVNDSMNNQSRISPPRKIPSE